MTFQKVKSKIVTIICTALIAAMVLTATGCSGSETKGEAGAASSAQSQIVSEASEQAAVSSPDGEAAVLGEGETVFNLSVVDNDGGEQHYGRARDRKSVFDYAAEELFEKVPMPAGRGP